MSSRRGLRYLEERSESPPTPSEDSSSADGSSSHRRRRRGRRRSIPRHSSRSSSKRRGSSAETKKKRTTAGSGDRLGTADVQELQQRLLSEKLGYSNESNPFHDATLSQPFIWKKKQKLLKAAGKTEAVVKKPEDLLLRTEQKLEEIERVRKRREQREAEEKLLEEQQAILAREREGEHFEEWEKREEKFHRNAAVQRAIIRLKQGLERPSDLLFRELCIADGGSSSLEGGLLPDSIDTLVERMDIAQLKQLLQDAQIHLSVCEEQNGEEDEFETPSSWALKMEKQDTPAPLVLKEHAKFWRAVLLVGVTALEQRLDEGPQRGGAPPRAGAPLLRDAPEGRDVSSGVPIVVLRELEAKLAARTEDELEQISAQVKRKLESISQDEASTEDRAYWEAIQERIPHFRAVAEIRRVHAEAAKKTRDVRRMQRSTKASSPAAREEPLPPATAVKVQAPQYDEAVSIYFPFLYPKNAFEGAKIMSIENFEEQRRNLRIILISHHKKSTAPKAGRLEENGNRAAAAASPYGSSVHKADRDAYENYVRDEGAKMDADEFVMPTVDEVKVQSSSQKSGRGLSDWIARFEPRKPRFFNRVKTGYEWTKYNQSHFDRDCPPPKAVQGYKFTLFYPDLIDPRKAPYWKLLPSDVPDTVLLRFYGSPPYEDVMFRIINREWDANPRRGFRNSFERGILQLHFNFKRYRYRK